MIRCTIRLLMSGMLFIFCTSAWAGSLALFSEEELQQLRHSEEEWVDEIYSYRLNRQLHQERQRTATRSFDGAPVDNGPLVSILTPELAGDHYRAPIPLRLLVYLKRRQAPINIESLEVKGKRGFFTLNITDRIKTFLRSPQEGEDADYVIDANIPKLGAGRYLITMSLADVEGNQQERQAFLEVVRQ